MRPFKVDHKRSFTCGPGDANPYLCHECGYHYEDHFENEECPTRGGLSAYPDEAERRRMAERIRWGDHGEINLATIGFISEDRLRDLRKKNPDPGEGKYEGI